MNLGHYFPRHITQSLPLACLLLCLHAFSPVSQAQAVTAPATIQTDAHERFVLPLSKLLSAEQSITLRGHTANIDFSLPVPDLNRVQHLQLQLKGVSSIDIGTPSSLVVRVNGQVQGQIALNPHAPQFSDSITIDPTLLKAGYNNITLRARHESQEICRDEEELWTEISTQQSGFVIQSERLAPTAKLSLIRQLLDKKLFANDIQIPIFSAPQPDAKQLEALGVIAQALGRRMDYVPVNIQHQTLAATLPTALAQLAPEQYLGLVVGTTAQTLPYVEHLTIPSGTAAHMAMVGDAHYPGRYLLVLTADQAEAQLQLAQSLMLESLPFEQEQWVAVTDLQLPSPSSLPHYNELPFEGQVILPIKALGFNTQTYTGRGVHGPVMRVWNNGWQSRIQLNLNLNYSAGLDPQSVMNVMANDLFVSSVPLQDPLGGEYLNYKVSIPADLLQLGWNTIALKAYMQPLGNQQQCHRERDEGLALTLHDDSSIQKKTGPSSQLPDLALLSGAGTYQSAVSGSLIDDVVLSNNELPLINASLNLLAKLAQTNPYKAWKLISQAQQTPSTTHQIWLGPKSELPENTLSSTSIQFDNPVELEIPLRSARLIVAHERFAPLNAINNLFSSDKKAEPAVGLANISIADLAQHRSAAWTHQTGDNTYTVFSADDNALLDQGIQYLTKPAIWGQLRGNYALWSTESPRVFSISLVETPFTSYGLRAGVGIWVSLHPWLSLGILLLVLATFVALIRWGLRIYHAAK